jgi:outer membrane lipoprotein-sorting protein
MSSNNALVPACFLLVAIPIGQALAAEAPTAMEIAGKMETLLNGYEDQMMKVTMTVYDVDGSKKAYEYDIYQKGDTKRLVLFTSGEVKGMATLVEETNRIYAYLPGFKKVRRVASHNMNQTMLGSDLANEDFANASWVKNWDLKTDHEDAENWYLTAVLKPGVEFTYARATLKVQKGTYLHMGTEYFDKAGTKIKYFHMENVKEFEGRKRPATLTIGDPKTGHKTILDVRDWKVNQNLSDDMFTVRYIQR